MHRINEVNVGILVLEVADGRTHIDESIAEILTAVACDKHQFSAVVKTAYVVACLCEHFFLLCGKNLVVRQFVNNHVERVDNGVARNDNLSLHFFLLEVAFRKRGRSEVERRDAARQLTVHLFRPRRIDVVGAQSRFHVPDRNLLIKRSESSRSRRCCVAMHKHHIWLRFLQHVAHTQNHPGSDII